MTQGAICYGCRYYAGSTGCKLGKEIGYGMEYCEDKREYISVIKEVDNSYKYYLEDGEQPRPGERIHIGPRKGRWVNRMGKDPDRKILKPFSNQNSNMYLEQVFDDPSDKNDPFKELGADQPIPEHYKDRRYDQSIYGSFPSEGFELIEKYVEKITGQGYITPPDSTEQKNTVDFALKRYRIAESHIVYQVLSKEISEEVLKNLNNGQGMISLGEYSYWSTDKDTIYRTIDRKSENFKLENHIDFPEKIGIPQYVPDAIIVEYELGSGSEGICIEGYEDTKSYLTKNHDNYIVTDMNMVDDHDNYNQHGKHVLKLTVRRGFSGDVLPVPEDIIPGWNPRFSSENTNTLGHSYLGSTLKQYEQNYQDIIDEITELYGDIPEGMKKRWDKFGARETGLVCIRDKDGKPSCILTGVKNEPNFELNVSLDKQAFYLSDSGKQDLMDWLPKNLNRFEKVRLYTSVDDPNASTYIGWGMSEEKYEGETPFNVYTYKKKSNYKGKDKADISLPDLIDVPVPPVNSTCNLYDAIDALDISRGEKERIFAKFMNVWKRSFTGYQYARELIQGDGDFKNIRKNYLKLHPEKATIWEQLYDIGSSFPKVNSLGELMQIFDSKGYVGMLGHEIVMSVKTKIGDKDISSIPIEEQERLVIEAAKEAYKRNEEIKFPPDPLSDEAYKDAVIKYNKDNAYAEEIVKMVDSIYARARAPKDAQIYRGIGYNTIIDIFGTDDPDELNKYIGEEISCPFYTSWTDDLPNAVYYSHSSDPKQPNRMFISNIKRGEHAIYMSPTPDMIQGEQEIVIGRDARYIFKGISKMKARDQSGSEYDIVAYNIEPVRD